MSKTYKVSFWKKAPFIRLFLPFAFGIILQEAYRFSLSQILYVVVISAVSAIILKLLPPVLQYRFRYIAGIGLSCILLSLGSWFAWQKDIRNNAGWYGHHLSANGNYLVVTINEPPAETPKTHKALAVVETVIEDGKAFNAKGKILLYVKKEENGNVLHYGDQLLIVNRLQLIQQPGILAGFDYGRYMGLRQVYHQVFLQSTQYTLLKTKHANEIRTLLYGCRDFVINALDQNLDNRRESALAKALLIGYRADLEQELVQAYSNAGVVHLIAISGLHLALIYALLLMVSLKIPFLKKNKVLRAGIILLCIWFFTFLTGAPPSVLRAAVMFTFLTLGILFRKSASVYNSLFISAFVLLCFDPFMLWDVGFQLSYLAVLGIFVTYKPIRGWLMPKSRILSYAWDLAAISLAAQIFTIPLCLYYFHQMPVLFLVANLVAVPLATIALWGSIAVVAVSPVPVAAFYLAKVLNGVLWLMNESVVQLNRIPIVTLPDIHFTITDTLLLFAIFSFSLYAFLYKKPRVLIYGLASLALLTFSKAITYVAATNARKMIVYNIRGTTAIDFISGENVHFEGDSSVLTQASQFNYHVKPMRLKQLVKRSGRNVNVFKSGNFYSAYQTKIFVLDSTFTERKHSGKLKCDYILITRNARVHMKDLPEHFDFSLILFDPSNSLWKINQWKKECEELHLRFHSIPDQGVFVASLLE